MTEDAPLYRVRWEIEVEGETPRSPRRRRLATTQTNPGTIATVLEVTEIRPTPSGATVKPVSIDLSPGSS